MICIKEYGKTISEWRVGKQKEGKKDMNSQRTNTLDTSFQSHYLKSTTKNKAISQGNQTLEKNSDRSNDFKCITM